MSNKNKVIVRIYGQEYTMVGQESREYMQKVANYVDDKMVYISKNGKVLSTAMTAVLTSLNIADEYFKIQEEKEAIKAQAMKPLEELEQTRNQLAATLTAFKTKEMEYIETIEALEEEKKSNPKQDEWEQLLKKMEALEATLNLKEKELEKTMKENEKLKNKIFDSQIKYVQARKELDSFIETFDEKE
ncbi:cell division protein ZapA [Marinisporobacter balticus]|uniref:Cell division protein ZapA n=1 Tax=Marinisporobacter balticus TaxID=2018667 RepID=A0A4V2SB02_9FIRM|nr:cell division protein ZapA [Marinisporobacter balticus]TCO73630.1 cell division protein ZapA [Marinisporobacter balticus]